MATNKNLLRSKLALAGHNQSDLASCLGVTEPTVSMKINGKMEFTQGEIRTIAMQYGLTPSEVTDIFFGDE